MHMHENMKVFFMWGGGGGRERESYSWLGIFVLFSLFICNYIQRTNKSLERVTSGLKQTYLI